MNSVLSKWVGVYITLAVGVNSEHEGRILEVGDDGVIFQPAYSPKQTTKLPPRRFYAWSNIRAAQTREDVPDDSGPGMAMVGVE